MTHNLVMYIKVQLKHDTMSIKASLLKSFSSIGIKKNSLNWYIVVSLFTHTHVLVYYIKKKTFLLNKNLYWDFSLEWFLCEGCLTGKF